MVVVVAGTVVGATGTVVVVAGTVVVVAAIVVVVSGTEVVVSASVVVVSGSVTGMVVVLVAASWSASSSASSSRSSSVSSSLAELSSPAWAMSTPTNTARRTMATGTAIFTQAGEARKRAQRPVPPDFGVYGGSPGSPTSLIGASSHAPCGSRPTSRRGHQ